MKKPFFGTRIAEAPNLPDDGTFGVYRIMDPTYAAILRGVLGPALDDAQHYLGRRRHNRLGEIVINGGFGVTIIPRYEVRRAMEAGVGVSYFGNPAADIPERLKGSAELEVPLRDVDWFGFALSARGLGAHLKPSSATKELRRQANAAKEWADAVTLSALYATDIIGVRTPDHTTFGRYGKPHDGCGLPADYKDRVTEIVWSHLRNIGMTSVSLGPVVVGDGYNQLDSALEG